MTVVDGHDDEVVKWLRMGTVDLAVVAGRHDGLELQPLLTDELLALLPQVTCWRPRRLCGLAISQGTPNPSIRSRSMPDDHAVQAWIRRNEAARAEDRRRDLERSMSERLEEAVRRSRIAAELETNLRRDPDVRTG